MATRIAPDAQEAIATAKFIRISPTKARQVVDLIRGRHVEDARRVLRFTPRGPSPTVAKVLESAIANAEHNRELPADELIVTRAWVNEGPTLRRFRPRALGRATRIRKRTCHISVVVGRSEELIAELRDTAPRAKKTTAKKTTAKKTTAKKTTAKKTTSKKTTAKKTTAKKTTAKKTTAKKTTKPKSDEKGQE
ncbi:MAG: 50S ribosomal protein L22 [Actinomycetota bacterium]|nr:50S ribosomal protein L22 [Actinomycetota bacterium]